MIPIRQHLKRHFGLEQTGIYTDDTIEMYTREIRQAIEAGEMIALVGPYGAGKTHLMDRVQTQMMQTSAPPRFVHVADLTPRNAKLSNVLNAVVADLSSESPRKDMEFRSRQVARLIFTHGVEAGRAVCIVIEDAHRLHHASLAALKRLRELRFNGRPAPCSIVLIGWPELAGKIRRMKHIEWRTSLIRLDEREGYLTLSRREAFLQRVFGDAITPETRSVIAARARVPAHMLSLVREAMQRAYLAGYRVIDERTVAPDPIALKAALGLSFEDIAREAGVGVSTAHDRVHNPRDDEYTRRVEDAIRRIHQRQTRIAS